MHKWKQHLGVAGFEFCMVGVLNSAHETIRRCWLSLDPSCNTVNGNSRPLCWITYCTGWALPFVVTVCCWPTFPACSSFTFPVCWNFSYRSFIVSLLSLLVTLNFCWKLRLVASTLRCGWWNSNARKIFYSNKLFFYSKLAICEQHMLAAERGLSGKLSSIFFKSPAAPSAGENCS